MRDVQNLTRAEMEAWCAEIGEPAYRAGQVLAWVHRKGAERFDDMSNLSRGLRTRLAEAFTLERLAPTTVAAARDGTQKLLFHLPAEGTGARTAAIESVLIPQVERAGGARDRLTLCISSQAGCGMGCGFCATAAATPATRRPGWSRRQAVGSKVVRRLRQCGHRIAAAAMSSAQYGQGRRGVVSSMKILLVR
jgi:adenine C2-methylase RlmN of 23S rRNA A2503 and tRNA A37